MHVTHAFLRETKAKPEATRCISDKERQGEREREREREREKKRVTTGSVIEVERVSEEIAVYAL